jgi:sialic acid synthase SpsE
MEQIQIGKHLVGGRRTFIIADVGSNHKQDLQLAKESVDAAVDAGVDAIKFQSIQLHDLYLMPDDKTTAFIKQLEFPEHWHHILKDYCDQKGILFFSSPTYMRAVDLLEAEDVSLYKLASVQAGTFPQIVQRVAALQKPVIFSTGISAYEEIIRTVKIFRQAGNNRFIILHCNSIYPTPAEKVNLSLMHTYRMMFGNPVGFSDHTNGTHTACAAVALGANVIEKHFTLDRNLGTPDSNSFACDPAELNKLVKEIREVEQSISSGGDRMQIQTEEQSFKDSVTYRLVASQEISAGTTLSETHYQYLRHSDGIDCRDAGLLTGKTTKQAIGKGELIRYEDINW